MFKYKGLYLMLTSGCTGWNPNRAEIFFARYAATQICPVVALDKWSMEWRMETLP